MLKTKLRQHAQRAHVVSWLCQQTAKPHPMTVARAASPTSPVQSTCLGLQQPTCRCQLAHNKCGTQLALYAPRRIPSQHTVLFSRGKTITRWPHCCSSAHVGATGLSRGLLATPAQTHLPLLPHTASAHKHLHSTSNSVQHCTSSAAASWAQQFKQNTHALRDAHEALQPLT